MDIRTIQFDIDLDVDDPSIKVLLSLSEKQTARIHAMSEALWRSTEALREIEHITTSGLALSARKVGKIFKICRNVENPKGKQ